MNTPPDNVLTRTVIRNRRLGSAAAICALLGSTMYIAGLVPANRYVPIQFAGAIALALGALCFVLAFALTNMQLRCARCLRRFFVDATHPQGTSIFSAKCAYCGYPAGATYDPDAKPQHIRTLAVRVFCPGCRATVSAERSSADSRGASITCGKCGHVFSLRQSEIAYAECRRGGEAGP
jgi:transcription elongation factor Elf1